MFAICERIDYYGNPATTKYTTLATVESWPDARRICGQHQDRLYGGELPCELPQNAYDRAIVICTIEEQGRTSDCHESWCRETGEMVMVRDEDDDLSQDPREVERDIYG